LAQLERRYISITISPTWMPW